MPVHAGISLFDLSISL